jgi:N6-adenosine-specific RNA methylase IME4
MQETFYPSHRPEPLHGPIFQPEGVEGFFIIMQIQIDAEFKALIPPLAPDELAQLEANILRDGCRDPLVVWDGILIDGHNRHEICTRHGLLFETIAMVFMDRDEALLWMEENQIGRRNLSDDQRSVFALSIQERRSKVAVRTAASIGGKSGGKGRARNSVSDTLAEPLKEQPKTDTRKDVAKEFNLPERKLRTVAEVKKAAPELIEKVRAGETTLLQAKREIKEAKREERREENRVKVSEAQAPEDIIKSEAKFATIVIDPPWDWGDEGDQDQMGRARPDYATMSKEQLMALPVGTLADDDCHLYMWITNRSLPKGFDLIQAWGFRYITAITWAKPSFGMGNYFRGQTEQILFAVKGSQPLKRKDVGTLFTAPRGPNGHSSKPVEFYDLVESCSPGPFLEMFSRSKRDGWVAWGEGSK